MGFVLLGIATLTPVGLNAALFGNIAHGLITATVFIGLWPKTLLALTDGAVRLLLGGR